MRWINQLRLSQMETAFRSITAVIIQFINNSSDDIGNCDQNSFRIHVLFDKLIFTPTCDSKHKIDMTA